jgi:hypothetical protein
MRPHIFPLVALLFPLASGTAGAGGKDEAAQELSKAAEKAATAKSYTFQIEERPGRGTGGAFTGKYAQGQPTFFKADGIEFFKTGKALAYEQGGKWHRSKTGTESDPLRILGAAAKVRRAALPHEELAGFAKNLKRVKKAQEKGQTVYSGDLTDAAVKRLAPSEFRSVAQSGQAKVWVDGGQVTRYAISLRLQGRLGGAEVDGTSLRTVTLSDPGKTNLEVPVAARKALE